MKLFDHLLLFFYPHTLLAILTLIWIPYLHFALHVVLPLYFHLNFIALLLLLLLVFLLAFPEKVTKLLFLLHKVYTHSQMFQISKFSTGFTQPQPSSSVTIQKPPPYSSFNITFLQLFLVILFLKTSQTLMHLCNLIFKAAHHYTLNRI